MYSCCSSCDSAVDDWLKALEWDSVWAIEREANSPDFSRESWDYNSMGANSRSLGCYRTCIEWLINCNYSNPMIERVCIDTGTINSKYVKWWTNDWHGKCASSNNVNTCFTMVALGLYCSVFAIRHNCSKTYQFKIKFIGRWQPQGWVTQSHHTK